MKAEDILQNSADKNMVQWDQQEFIKTHPTLHKTIIEAINQALIIDSVVKSFYCDDADERLTKCKKQCKYCLKLNE